MTTAETGTTGSSDLALELFGPVADVKAGTKKEIIYLDLTEIEEDPDNPRTEVDAQLEDAVRRNGVEKPVIVIPIADAEKLAIGIKYRLFDGARRYLASIAAGFKTIPAIIESKPLTRVQKLIRQAGLNEHAKLPPMDEARLYAEIQHETGWTDQQIADVCKKPKSTVSDRLALARVPEVFRPLFESGLLSAAAAPIVRRFLDVPQNVLEIAARTAPSDFAWETAKRAGKAVEIKDVGRVLDKIILEEQMRELPERLVLLYQGPTCKVAGVTYASDVAAYLSAQRIAEKEERRAVGEAAERDAAGNDFALTDESEKLAAKAKPTKSGSGREVVGTTPMAASGEPQLSRAERKRIEEEEAHAKEAEKTTAAWRAATPKILDAVAAALKKANITGGPKDPIANALLEVFAKANGIDEQTAERLVGRGSTPASFLRFLVMALLVVDIEDDFQHESLPRRFKALGLNVDVLKLVATARKEIEKPTPKAAEPKVAKAAAPKAAAKKPAKPVAKKKAKR